MAAGDIKTAYGASTAITFTSLASLASSATFVAGAECTAIDNTSNKFLRAKVGGTIKVGTATAGEIRVYAHQALEDTPTYADVLDGTDSAETFGSVEMRDAAVRIAHVITCNATDDLVYPVTFDIADIFGIVPDYWGLFVTHDTVGTLFASGSALEYTGSYATVEQ